MDREQMDRLIEVRLQAEHVGAANDSMRVCTGDVEHDVVGSPAGQLYGREEARRFSDRLRPRLRTVEMVPIRAYYGEDFCVAEHEWRGTVEGAVNGMDGDGRPASFRVLHIWEFRDGLISRENVWFDVWAMLRQLATESATASAMTGGHREPRVRAPRGRAG